MKKVNFLPEDYMEKKAQQRTNIICLSLFLVVIAGVGVGFMLTERRQHDMDTRMEEINKQMHQASQSLQQLEKLEGKREQMMSKASLSASLMEPVPRSLLLATITNDLPVGVSLTELELVSKDVAAKSRKTKNRRSRNKKSKKLAKKQREEEKKAIVVPQWETTIEIVGLAPTDIRVAELISNLHQSSLFKEVNLVYSEEHEAAEEIVRKFKLEMLLDPKARASEEDVATARQKGVRGM